MNLRLLPWICLNFHFINCTPDFIEEPGPVVKATIGEIWPKPFQQTSSDDFFIVRPSLLKFKIQSESCDILSAAVRRYQRIIKSLLKRDIHSQRHAYHGPNIVEHPNPEIQNSSYFAGFLDEITINLKNPCEHKPHPQMTETYQLHIANASAYLESESIWGILRGLESFSQLLVVLSDHTALRVNGTEIYDKPRYSHRGLLVDTSRHFIDVSKLKQILDGMAYNKLNVFHWHIVDDHSFPYESVTFPELSAEGAYNMHMIYSQSEIKAIIEYARLRGIRTLAEFDTPGHTRSWGVSHPELLTACEGVYSGKLGPMDPTNEDTYIFMQKLLAEVGTVFSDEYIHLGGDEVGFQCWNSSTKIRDFMKKENITRYEVLEERYIQRIVDMVEDLQRKSIVWQEVFENGVQLAPATVVHVWTGDRSKLLNTITKRGFPAILSSCWYLDWLSNGGDWTKYYTCEPSDFPGDKKQQSLLIGGEACMWSEVVDDTNIVQRIFPRASAAAEKLWSQKSINNVTEASRRLEEHTCRMRKRGIPAQPPNGPGFCL
ncbi:beta-hexosaminidase subunit beta-like [Sitodiplosis mosellana]|uniref:beta-hexosaminidase subunit beta-like n=1 Tax=Sitodiplosis mosellana TaxID=263140 RepID=UPI0024443CEF|nr:beta-hexosaminidase subunit beta-like [Sitodiplosis mosellana]